MAIGVAAVVVSRAGAGAGAEQLRPHRRGAHPDATRARGVMLTDGAAAHAYIRCAARRHAPAPGARQRHLHTHTKARDGAVVVVVVVACAAALSAPRCARSALLCSDGGSPCRGFLACVGHRCRGSRTTTLQRGACAATGKRRCTNSPAARPRVGAGGASAVALSGARVQPQASAAARIHQPRGHALVLAALATSH